MDQETMDGFRRQVKKGLEYVGGEEIELPADSNEIYVNLDGEMFAIVLEPA